jgi:hypothetical protein
MGRRKHKAAAFTNQLKRTIAGTTPSTLMTRGYQGNTISMAPSAGKLLWRCAARIACAQQHVAVHWMLEELPH